MKIREKSRALCAIECICHIAFSYPIIALIWFMFADSDGMRITVFLFTAVSEVLMYILRRRLHKRWELYGIIAVYLIFLVVFMNYLGGIYLFAGIVVSVICIVIVWLSSVADIEVPSAGIATLLFVIGTGVWLATAEKPLIIFYICEAVYVFSLIIYKNLKNADDFIWQNRRTAFLSVGQIKNANYLITFILGVITLVVTSICAVLCSPLLNLLKQPILKLLSDLFGANVPLPDMGNTTGENIEQIEEVVGQMSNKGSSGSIIVAVILSILAISGVVMLVVFIMHIIRQLSSGTMDGDIREYIIPIRNEDVSSVEKEAEEKIDDKPAKKIRKIYKRKIKSNLKKNGSMLKASTPSEQREIAGLSGEGIDEFIELYRKARYSNEECTDGDVEKMKVISKKNER